MSLCWLKASRVLLLGGHDEWPSRQRQRLRRIVSTRSGSVRTDSNHSLSLSIALSHTTDDPFWLHTQTWLASSGSPHWGQASDTFCFQSFMYLPMPHIPIVCLIIKVFLVLGTSLRAWCIMSQCTKSMVPSAAFSLFFQYALAIPKCMMSCTVSFMPTIFFLYAIVTKVPIRCCSVWVSWQPLGEIASPEHLLRHLGVPKYLAHDLGPRVGGQQHDGLSTE